MIEDYIKNKGQPNEEVIRLGWIPVNKAQDILYAHGIPQNPEFIEVNGELEYAFDPDLCVEEHIKKSLNRFSINYLPEPVAKSMIMQNGLEEREANQYLHSCVYDVLDKNFSDTDAFIGIQCKVYMDTKIASLNLYVRDFLTLQHLYSRLYPIRKEFRLNNYSLELSFNLCEGDTEKAIIKRIENFFYLLMDSIDDTGKVAYPCITDELLSEIIAFFRKYCFDFQKNFPGGNYYLRNPPCPVTYTTSKYINGIPVSYVVKFIGKKRVEIPYPEQDPRVVALLKAVEKRNVLEVQRLLKEGVDPNLTSSNIPILTSIIPYDEKLNNYENLIEITELLIKYKVRDDRRINFGNVLEILIQSGFSCKDNPNLLRLYWDLILRIWITSARFNFITVRLHLWESNPIFSGWVSTGLTELKNIRNKIPSKIYYIPKSNNFYITYSIHNIEIQVPAKEVYRMLDNKIVEIEAIYLSDVIKNNELKNRLCDIFQYSWREKFSSTQSAKLFEMLLKDEHGKVYFRLVRIKNSSLKDESILAGFAMHDVISIIKDQKKAVINRIMLAVYDDRAPKCPNIMTIAAYSNCFLLQKFGLSMEMLTIYEAATFAFFSKMCEIGVKYFPQYKNKILQNWVDFIIINEILYPIKDVYTQNAEYCVFDGLGDLTDLKLPQYLTPQSIAAKHIRREITLFGNPKGLSLIVAFLSDRENLAILALYLQKIVENFNCLPTFDSAHRSRL